MIAVHFSAHLDLLIQKLYELLQKRKDPLTPVTIVLSPIRLKNWIEQSLMRKYGIIANIVWISPTPHLFAMSQNEFSSKNVWNKKKFTQKICAALYNFLYFDDASIPKALGSYLNKNDLDSKIFSLRCLEFSTSFSEWIVSELKQDPITLVQWVESPALSPFSCSWQAHFWRKIVEVLGWQDIIENTPIALVNFSENFAQTKTIDPFILMLVGTYFSDLEKNCYQMLSKTRDIDFLAWNLLSEEKLGVCADGRGQNLEDFNQRFLPTHQTQWMQMNALEDARYFLVRLNDSKKENKETALSVLKNKLFENKCSNFSIKKNFLNDQSMVLRRSSSMLREVEASRDWILEKLASHSSTFLKDFIILVPNLELYGPFLTAVFSSSRSGPKIPVGISTVHQAQKYHILHDIIDFLRIWDSSETSPIEFLNKIGSISGWEGFYEEANLLDNFLGGLLQRSPWWTQMSIPHQTILEHVKNETYDQIVSLFSINADLLQLDVIAQIHQFLRLFDRLELFLKEIRVPKSLEEWENYFLTQVLNFFDSRSETFKIFGKNLSGLFGGPLKDVTFKKMEQLSYSALLFLMVNQLPKKYNSFLVGPSQNIIVCTDNLEAFRGVLFKHVLTLGFELENYDLKKMMRAYQEEVSIDHFEKLIKLRSSFLAEIFSMAEESIYFSFIDEGNQTKDLDHNLLSILEQVWDTDFIHANFLSRLSEVPFDLSAFKLQAGARSYAQEWFNCREIQSKNFKIQEKSVDHHEHTLNISLKEMSQFFEYPLRYWLKKFFKGQLPKRSHRLALSHQQRNQRVSRIRRAHLFKTILDQELSYNDSPDLLKDLVDKRLLPKDIWGTYLGETEIVEILRLVKKAKHLGYQKKEMWLNFFEASCSLYTLSKGQNDSCGAFSIVFSKVRTRDLLRLWLRHLLQSVNSKESCHSMILSYHHDIYMFKPVSRSQAEAHLRDCLKPLKLHHSLPYPFFIESAGAWVKTFLEAKALADDAKEHTVQEKESAYKAKKDAWTAFNAVWLGTPFSQGEREFSGFDLGFFDKNWDHLHLEKIMRALLEPMYQSMEVKEGCNGAKQ